MTRLWLQPLGCGWCAPPILLEPRAHGAPADKARPLPGVQPVRAPNRSGQHIALLAHFELAAASDGGELRVALLPPFEVVNACEAPLLLQCSTERALRLRVPARGGRFGGGCDPRAVTRGEVVRGSWGRAKDPEHKFLVRLAASVHETDGDNALRTPQHDDESAERDADNADTAEEAAAPPQWSAFVGVSRGCSVLTLGVTEEEVVHVAVTVQARTVCGATHRVLTLAPAVELVNLSRLYLRVTCAAAAFFRRLPPASPRRTAAMNDGTSSTDADANADASADGGVAVGAGAEADDAGADCLRLERWQRLPQSGGVGDGGTAAARAWLAVQLCVEEEGEEWMWSSDVSLDDTHIGRRAAPPVTLKPAAAHADAALCSLPVPSPALVPAAHAERPNRRNLFELHDGAVWVAGGSG